MHKDHLTLQTHALDFWYARGAIVLIAGLQLVFVNDLLIGPRWLAPVFELALLAPLSVAGAWTHGKARAATSEEHALEVRRLRRTVQWVALLLTFMVMFINLDALVSVTRALLQGGRGPNGRALLLDALNIWFTNVVIFTLLYWNSDRDGPAMRGLGPRRSPDFLFPQMMGSGDETPDWTPGFVDYFYVSFTNATAFSPTDTMPLSQRSKLLMTLQAGVSLLTVALVASRAVNILN